MHSLIPRSLKFLLVCGLAWVIIWLNAHLFDNPVTIGTLATIVEFLVMGLLALSWPWIAQRKWRALPKWLQIDLSGTWTGTIVAVRPLEGGALKTIEKPATAKIVQSWSQIRIDIHTDEMVGESVNAMVAYRAPADLEILYMYQTEPRSHVSGQNPPQNLGCAKARVDLDQPDTIHINYSNERGRGDITLRRSGPPPSDHLTPLVRRLFHR
ncbi:MAG: hypothetical protein AB7M05_20335 [Alphaproteobacteria bacterium]